MAKETENSSSTHVPQEVETQSLPSLPRYLEGFRFYMIFTVLCISLFLVNLEIPVIITALISITEDLGGFGESSWIISSYMLGYAGVLVIYAKLSDIFGRKPLLLLAILLFTIFSAACAASQNVTQIIVFRAFQGVGGAAIYSIGLVLLLELVPSEKYPKYTSMLAIVYSCSLLCGPIIGGAASQTSTWRWAFFLNLPPAVLTGIVFFFALPNRFPYHAEPHVVATGSKFALREYLRTCVRRVDFFGSALLLTATLLLVAALEEVNYQFQWQSAFTITLLVISGSTWVLFFFWERRVTLRSKLQEPVFPWRFVRNRVWMGIILNALFLGGTYFVTLFQLPLRFQIVNGLSPLEAGLRFIPFTLASPFGSGIAPLIAKVFKVPLFYLFAAASSLQIIGFALLSSLPATVSIPASQYGYQIIAGFGCGVNSSLMLLMTPYVIESRDKSVAMGAVAQVRVMGGVIGLATVTSIANGFLQSQLGDFLSGTELAMVFKSASSIMALPLPVQDLTRTTFANAYNLQMKVLAGFAGGQVLSSLVMWQKDPITV